MRVDRRSALGLIGAGAAFSSTGATAAQAAAVRFDHGVASGDPTAKGAILWTRVTPVDPAHSAPIPVRWHVAQSADGKPIESGEAQARPARDFTVKVEPKRLKPGQDYVYWFEAADGTRSPNGRFRTLPQGKTAEAVFAVVSCQLHPGGYFNAYRSIASATGSMRSSILATISMNMVPTAMVRRSAASSAVSRNPRMRS